MFHDRHSGSQLVRIVSTAGEQLNFPQPLALPPESQQRDQRERDNHGETKAVVQFQTLGDSAGRRPAFQNSIYAHAVVQDQQVGEQVARQPIM
jgi:hypothetical protein